MTLRQLRTRRTLLMVGISVVLPVTGGVWALASNAFTARIAIFVGLIAAVIVVLEETISARVDGEIDRLNLVVERQGIELSALNEAVREEDRIVEMLEVRNTNLAAELVSRRIETDAA